MTLLVVFLILVALFAVVIQGEKRKQRRLQGVLRAAHDGSTRIEAVKAKDVGDIVAQYARAGWTVVGQSSAKSLATQARVTITFRKV